MKTVFLRCVLWLAVALSWQATAQVYDTNNDTVQTFVGSGFFGDVDGVGEQTMFNNPKGVVADSFGNLYVLDVSNSLIRKVTPDGTVSTLASSQNPANTAIAIDHKDQLLIPVSNGANGYLYFVNPTNASYGSYSLPGVTYPWGVCVDSANNKYISDYAAQKIYRYKTNGVLELFVGSGNPGSRDGNGIFTSFNGPQSLAADSADNIYVFDSGNFTIRRINQNRDVVTVAGGGANDTDGSNPSFSSVFAMCMDDSGNLILGCGSSVRKMSVTTNAVTMAGHFAQTGFTNGVTNLARFSGARGVCVSQGKVFVADSSNHRIRSISYNATPQPVDGGSLALNTYAGLQIIGVVGRTYQVQSSSNMTDWNPEASVLLTRSPYLWMDPTPLGQHKVYRAFLLP